MCVYVCVRASNTARWQHPLYDEKEQDISGATALAHTTPRTIRRPSATRFLPLSTGNIIPPHLLTTPTAITRRLGRHTGKTFPEKTNSGKWGKALPANSTIAPFMSVYNDRCNGRVVQIRIREKNQQQQKQQNNNNNGAPVAQRQQTQSQNTRCMYTKRHRCL
ncbi:hypothetical protein QTP88_014277 [Uroleucon formosanum]